MGWVHAIKCLFLTIKAELLWFSYTVFPGRIADSKDSKDDVSWVWEFNFCTQNIKYVAEKHWTHQWFQPKSSLRMHACDSNPSNGPTNQTLRQEAAVMAQCSQSNHFACLHGRAAAFYDKTDTKVNMWIGKKTLPLIRGPFSTHCSKRGKISLQPLATTVTKAADCWCIIHSHCTII